MFEIKKNSFKLRRSLRLLSLPVFCLLSIYADGQNASVSSLVKLDTIKDTSVKWDLQTCIDYAKRNNLQLNTLRYSQQTSQQQYYLSKAAVLPNLTGNIGQTVGHGNVQNLATGHYQSQFISSGSYGVNSSWTLYQGGYLKSDIQQKNLSVESANLNAIAQENDMTLQITQYYLNILLDKESIVYQENVVSTSQAQLDQAERRLTAGSIARKDVAQFRSQLANDKYNLITSQNAKRQDLLTLKQVLELQSSVTFDIVEPDTIVSRKAIPTLDEVRGFALQNRPEVKNGQVQVDIANLDLTKAKSGYKPTIMATGSLGSSYSNGNQGYFTQLDNAFSQQLGLSMSIPILTRRQNKTNVEEAKINIDQARINFMDTRNTLALNVEKYYINAVNAENQFSAAEEAFKYNQETYRIANEQLKLGVSNMVDFLQQKVLYTQALQQFIQAKYNAALTIEIYEFYNGQQVKL
ncbi:MAG TPA: TolC family protein [Mucilaginibacter sp.]|jgi:outer membrane protein